MDFPRLVYKSASDHKLANNEAEFETLLEEDWFATVPEALGLTEKPASAAKAASVGKPAAADWNK